MSLLLLVDLELVKVRDAHGADCFLDDLAAVVLHGHARLVKSAEHRDPCLSVASWLQGKRTVYDEVLNVALDVLKFEVEVSVLHHVGHIPRTITVRYADGAFGSEEVLYVGNHHANHRTHRGGRNRTSEYAEAL